MLFRFRLSLALLVAELVGTVEPVAAEKGGRLILMLPWQSF